MRLVLSFLGIFFSCFIFSIEENDAVEFSQTEGMAYREAYQSLEKYHFRIQMKNYLFSTFFEIDSDDTYIGTIKKSAFRIGDHYDLSDKNGWCATGIRRIFSLGSIFSWAAEIDILGTDGKSLGFIEGKMLTTAKAKFNIYNRNEELVAVAYMDFDNKGVTICAPDNEAFPLARFNRVYAVDIHDSWDVVVYEPQNLDDRVIRIFAAFCVDVQDSFHEDK